MENTLLNSIAPCGLNCAKCFAFVGGDIQTQSLELQKLLGNFDVYAERFSNLLEEPTFNEYSSFKKLLDYFAKGSCQGCRKEQCKLFKQCGVRKCHQEKEVGFCYECSDFPCKNTNFDQHLQNRWIKINNRIREIGISSYFEEIKNKPRY